MQRLLDNERLVTIVGAGGVGNTGLALELARQAQAATVLPLAPLTDPATCRTCWRRRWACTRSAATSSRPALRPSAVGDQLLVLDGCEHLLDAVRDLVVCGLDACPEVSCAGNEG